MSIKINYSASHVPVLPIFASGLAIPEATASVGVVSFGAAAAPAPIAEDPAEPLEVSFNEALFSLGSWDGNPSIDIVLSDADWDFLAASLNQEPTVNPAIRQLLNTSGAVEL